MGKKEKIFEGHIHNENYREQFRTKMARSNTFICDHGNVTESIGGQWHFTIDPYDTCLRVKWFEEKKKSEVGKDLPLDYNFDKWEKITVPSCWNMHHEKYFWYEGISVYTRTFKYKNCGEKKVFLKFDGASYETTVFLNRKYIGAHDGASTGFCLDITEHLQEENRILIVVDNTRSTTRLPMRNTDWFNYGGIYRDIRLIRLPENYIKDTFVYLKPNGDFNTIVAEVEVAGNKTEGNLLLNIEELGISQEIEIKKGKGDIEIAAKPDLWSPENPILYNVQITYEKDIVSDRIGFREVKVDGTDIILNGKKIFLRGICAHEESIKNGKAVSQEEIRKMYERAKELGCNFMRLAHYPHSANASKIADELGILLWEEIPVYWAIAFNNKATQEDGENQLSELIVRDRNRASVILWSVGNENADTDERFSFMKKLVDLCKKLDPTRLTTAACLVDRNKNTISDRLAEVLDVIGINEYYGWYFNDFELLVQLFENSDINKPVIIAEFGAGAKSGHRGTIEDMFTEDCQKYIYEQQIETIQRISYVKGTCPWILYDFRCPRRANEYQDFYNRKGLLSPDLKYKKLAFYTMQEFYKKMKEKYQ